MWPFKKRKFQQKKSDDKFSTRAVLRTHTGLVRNQNEDSLKWYVSREDGAAQCSLAIVADGMGGHAAGEVASQMCVDAFVDAMRTFGSSSPTKLLSTGLEQANTNIFQRAAQQKELLGMGTTCSALLFLEKQTWMINVGDSRIYHWRKNELHQITEDDTMVNYLFKEGKLTKEEVASHPNANVLVKAVGTNPNLEAEPKKMPMDPLAGDIFLLCSDGLYDMVRHKDIVHILQTQKDLDTCADQLIKSALAQGGLDNISVILIAINDAVVLQKNEEKEKTESFNIPATF